MSYRGYGAEAPDNSYQEQRIRDILMKMSKDEIIEFMRKKGNWRKKELFEEMVF